MRLWWSEGGCEIEAPADGVTGVHVTIDASGASTLRDLGRPSPARGEEPFTGLHDRVGIAAAMVRPELIDAARLADGRVVALLDDGGKARMGIATRLLDGASWTGSSVLATKGSRSIAWPKGLLWPKKAPRSRARKMSTKRGELSLHAAAGAIAVTCQYTGVAAIFRGATTTPTLLRLPMGPGVRVHAVPTPLGVLITVATEEGAGAVIHVDDDGTILGQRAVHAPLPALPTADKRAVLFVGDEAGGSGRLHLLRLPDLAAEGPSVHIGFPAKALALADNGRIALADPERLVRGILGEDGLTLGAVVDLVTLIAASGEGSQAVSASPELALPAQTTAAVEPAPVVDDAEDSPPKPDAGAAGVQDAREAEAAEATADPEDQPDDATPSAEIRQGDDSIAAPQADDADRTSVAAGAEPASATAADDEATPDATTTVEPTTTCDDATECADDALRDIAVAPGETQADTANAASAAQSAAAPASAPESAAARDVAHAQAPESDEVAPRSSGDDDPEGADAARTEAQPPADDQAQPETAEGPEPAATEPDSDADAKTLDAIAADSRANAASDDGAANRDEAEAATESDSDTHTKSLDATEPDSDADAKTLDAIAADTHDHAASDDGTANRDEAAAQAATESDSDADAKTLDAIAADTHANAASDDGAAKGDEAEAAAETPADASEGTEDAPRVELSSGSHLEVDHPRAEAQAEPASAGAPTPSPGAYAPALAVDDPSFGLALGGTPAGGWLGTVGKEFELTLRIRSTGRPSRGLRLAAGGEALARGLVQLVAIVGDGTRVAFGPSEAGMRRAELPAMAIPSGVLHPFDPPPQTEDARAAAESALAASHVELRVVARGIRPGGALLTLSVSALGSSAPPLRRIRPLNIR